MTKEPCELFCENCFSSWDRFAKISQSQTAARGGCIRRLCESKLSGGSQAGRKRRELSIRSAYTSVVKDLGVTLDSHLTFNLFLMSTTPVAFSRVRFILSADSENLFRKMILSALSVPSFYRNWIIVMVCSVEFPLVKLRNFRDCRIPLQD